MDSKKKRQFSLAWAVNIMPQREITMAHSDVENEPLWEIPPLLRLQMHEHSPYVELSYGHTEAVTVHYLDLQRALDQLLDKVMIRHTPLSQR